jgi:hypothetical protein
VRAVIEALEQDEQARRLAYEAARADATLLGQAEAADDDLAAGLRAVSTASEQLRALGSDDEVVVALTRQAGRLEAMRAAETLVGAPRGLGPAGLREAAATLRAGPGAGLEASEAFLVAGAAELARQVAHTTADTSTRAWASGRAARLSRVLAEADAITVEPERRTARARAADLAARVIDEALPHLGGADPPDGRPPVVPPGDDSDRGSSGGAGGGTLLTRARVTPAGHPAGHAAGHAAGQP